MLREMARFAEFDKLRAQGQTTDFAGSYQTVSKDIGGFRTWLHERNLHFRGSAVNVFTADISGNGLQGGSRLYNGQRPTVSTSHDLRLSWKIGGSGEDITQINVGGLASVSNWRLSPSGVLFTNLNLYSTFFDRTVEVRAGYNTNIADFIGIFSGGNPILAGGLATSIPLSSGMSGGMGVAPTFSVQLNAKNGFYSRSGVQRSLLPTGLVDDAAKAGSGLKFTRAGAKALYIQEFGVRRAASPENRQIWIRGGGAYNTSLYNRLDGRGQNRNWMAFALADYQLTRPDPTAFYKGIYVGASALFARDTVNAYTRTLEGRVYALGMVPGRPADQMTFTIGMNRFSRSGGDAIRAAGGVANRNQFSVGALYAFQATEGLFISPSVTYIRNPSFVGDFKPAINLGTSLTVLY